MGARKLNVFNGDDHDEHPWLHAAEKVISVLLILFAVVTVGLLLTAVVKGW